MCAAVNAVSASACADLGGLDLGGQLLGVRQHRRALLGAAAPTCLLTAFCSARSVSAVEIAARRAASAASSTSTSAGSSPRLSCDRRTASGSSRSNFRSITARTLLSLPDSRPTGPRPPVQPTPHGNGTTP